MAGSAPAAAFFGVALAIYISGAVAFLLNKVKIGAVLLIGAACLAVWMIF